VPRFFTQQLLALQFNSRKISWDNLDISSLGLGLQGLQNRDVWLYDFYPLVHRQAFRQIIK